MKNKKNELGIITTDRLVLRTITLDDAPSIYLYAADSDVARFTMWDHHKALEDTIRFIKNYVSPNYQKKIPEPYGITLKDRTDAVIGTVGCFWNSQTNNEMELSYALSKKLWGQGIMVEASKALISFVFKNYDVHRIQARCKTENTASEKVLKKINMIYEGTLRDSVYHKGRYWSMRYYSVLKYERESSLYA